MLEFLLNLKEVVIKSYTNEQHIRRLRVQVPALITAGLFNFPSKALIIDNWQYIATSNNTIFKIEFRIERGYEYKLVNKYTQEKSIESLQTDDKFMPVTKV